MLPALKPTSKLRLPRQFCCLALLFALSATLAEASDDAPEIPVSSIDRYTVSSFEERLESFDLTRLRLSGRTGVWVTDPIEGHRAVQTQDAVSSRFVHYTSSKLKVDIISFPKDAFARPLTPETLRAYLDAKAQTAPPERNFEILEIPEKTTGPAKFRFLGERALTLRYARDTKSGRIVRGENWVEVDDVIHVVAVEAPPNSFAAQFEDVRATMNSSFRVKR